MDDDTTLVALIGLPIALVLIMGSLGLSLTTDDFRRVARSPRGVVIGLANLTVLSPLLAFGLAELFDLDPLLAVGLVLLGSTPGGASANLMTHLARGDTALSVSMTALSSIAAVVTVPAYLAFSVDHFGAGIDDEVSILGTAGRVIALTVVPLLIGMRIRATRPAWALAQERRAKLLGAGALVVVVIIAAAEEWGTITENFTDLALATLSLNLLAMGISFTIARLARLDLPQATAVALELGVHNGTVAIAVGALIVDDLAIPAAVYTIFMYVTAALFARALYRRNTRALA